jgi:hypothetical protein
MVDDFFKAETLGNLPTTIKPGLSLNSRGLDLTTETNLQKDMQPERDASELLPLSHLLHTAVPQRYEYIYIYIHISLKTTFFLYSRKCISKLKHS